MSIKVEELRDFQSRELEQLNLGTNGRQPVFSKTIEWSLLEIVILLTEIRDSINAVANKRRAWRIGLAATPSGPRLKRAPVRAM